MALRPRFSAAAQKAQTEKEQQQYSGDVGGVEDDEESVKGMARLFAELGEAYTALIATGAATTLSLSWVSSLFKNGCQTS